MNKDKKYGNDHYWAFIPEGWNNKEIAIWSGPEGNEEIIGRASNKYDAKHIVDALISYTESENRDKFDKKEVAFLEFVCSNCPEPYSTMASNAILWNDKETYRKLVEDFSKIYS